MSSMVFDFVTSLSLVIWFLPPISLKSLNIIAISIIFHSFSVKILGQFDIAELIFLAEFLYHDSLSICHCSRLIDWFLFSNSRISQSSVLYPLPFVIFINCTLSVLCHFNNIFFIFSNGVKLLLKIHSLEDCHLWRLVTWSDSLGIFLNTLKFTVTNFLFNILIMKKNVPWKSVSDCVYNLGY